MIKRSQKLAFKNYFDSLVSLINANDVNESLSLFGSGVSVYLCSSGATDREKSAIYSEVVPYMNDFCSVLNLEFELIDGNWHSPYQRLVHDQDNLEFRKESIRKSLINSIGCSVLCLFGEDDEENVQLLPEVISSETFQKLLSKCSASQMEILARFYMIDASKTFKLQKISQIYPTFYFNDEEEQEYVISKYSEEYSVLKELFANAARNGDAECRLETSVEKELGLIFESVENKDKVVVARQSSVTDHTFPVLKKLLDFVPAARSREYRVPDFDEEQAYSQYLQALCDDICHLFSNMIIEALKKDQHHLPNELEIEILQHEEVLNAYVSNFVNREKEVGRIEKELFVKGKVGVVTGDKGVGKSAILSHIVSKMQNETSNTTVIYRRIGSTPSSSNLISLLKTVIAQVNPPLLKNCTTHSAIIKSLEYVLQSPRRNPLLIVFTNFDELKDFDHDEAMYDRIWKFLPNFVSENVTVVISCTQNVFSCTERFTRLGYRFTKIKKLNDLEVEAIFNAICLSRGIGLSQAQKDFILGTLQRNDDVSVSFLRFVCETVGNWQYDESAIHPAVGKWFPNTISGCVEFLIKNLEDYYGLEFVETFFGYVVISEEYGLSFWDIVKICLIPTKVNMHDLSPGVITKFIRDASGLLNFKRYGNTTVYTIDKLVRKTFIRRYLLKSSMIKVKYSVLADNFAPEAEMTPRESTRFSEDPHSTAVETFDSRIVFLYLHSLISAMRLDESSEMLLSFRHISAIVTAGHTFTLLSLLTKILSIPTSPNRATLLSLYQFIALEYEFINEKPPSALFYVAYNQPEDTPVSILARTKWIVEYKNSENGGVCLDLLNKDFITGASLSLSLIHKYAVDEIVSVDETEGIIATLQKNGIFAIWEVHSATELLSVEISLPSSPSEEYRQTLEIYTPKIALHVSAVYVAVAWLDTVYVFLSSSGDSVGNVKLPVDGKNSNRIVGLEWVSTEPSHFEIAAVVATIKSDSTDEHTEAVEKVQVAVWNIMDLELPPKLVELANAPRNVLCTPVRVVYEANHTLKSIELSNLASGVSEKPINLDHSRISSVIKNGETLNGGSSFTVRLWGLNEDGTFALYFFENFGAVLIRCDDDDEVVGVLAITALKEAGVSINGKYWMRKPAISKEGKEIAFFIQGEGVGVWTLESKRLVRKRNIMGFAKDVSSVRWSKNGKYLITYGTSGVTRVWRISPSLEEEEQQPNSKKYLVMDRMQIQLRMGALVEGFDCTLDAVNVTFTNLQTMQGWPKYQPEHTNVGLVISSKNVVVLIDKSTWTMRKIEKCDSVLSLAAFATASAVIHRSITTTLSLFDVDSLFRGPVSFVPLLQKIKSPTAIAFYDTVNPVNPNVRPKRTSYVRNETGLKMATGYENGLVIVYKKAQTPEIQVSDAFCLLRKSVKKLEFSSSGSRLGGLLADNTAFILDTNENAIFTETFAASEGEIEHKSPEPTLLTFADLDDGLVAVGGRGFLGIWDVEREGIAYLHNESGSTNVTPLAVCWFSDDAVVAAVCEDNRIRFWDIVKSKLIKELKLWNCSVDLISAAFYKAPVVGDEFECTVSVINRDGNIFLFNVCGLESVSRQLYAPSRSQSLLEDTWTPSEDVQTKLILPKETLAIISESMDLEEAPAIDVARFWGRMLVDELISGFGITTRAEDVPQTEDPGALHLFDFLDENDELRLQGFVFESALNVVNWKGISHFPLSAWIPLKRPKSSMWEKQELVYYTEYLLKSNAAKSTSRRKFAFGISINAKTAENRSRLGCFKPSYCVLDAFDGRVYYEDGSMNALQEWPSTADWLESEDLVFGCGYRPLTFTAFFTRNGEQIAEVRLSQTSFVDPKNMHFIISAANSPHIQVYVNACQLPLMAFWFENARKSQFEMVEMLDPKLGKIWTSPGYGRAAVLKKLEDKVVAAALHDRWDAVRFLLKCSAELSLKNVKASVLHDVFASALSQGLHYEVKVLLDQGAPLPSDVAILQSLMIAVLNCTSNKGYESILRLLVQRAPANIGPRSLLQGDVVIGAAIQRDLPEVILFCLDFEEEEDVDGDSFGQSTDNPNGRDDVILAALERGWVDVLEVMGGRGYFLPHDTNALHAFAPQVAHWFSEFELDDNGLLLYEGKIDQMIVLCLGLNTFNNWLPLPSRVDTLRGSQYYYEVVFDEFNGVVGIGATDNEELIPGTSHCFYTSTGEIYLNSVKVASAPPFKTGDTVGCLFVWEHTGFRPPTAIFTLNGEYIPDPNAPPAVDPISGDFVLLDEFGDPIVPRKLVPATDVLKITFEKAPDGVRRLYRAAVFVGPSDAGSMMAKGMLQLNAGYANQRFALHKANVAGWPRNIQIPLTVPLIASK